MNESFESVLPPGTFILNEESPAGQRLVLHPEPTNDPNDPLNWSKSRKAIQFTIVLFYVLFTFVLNDIGGTGYESLVNELGMTFQIYNLTTGLNYTGLAIGCFMFIPLAYRYGRRPVYLLSLVLQLASAIWSAKVTSAKELIAVNLIMGLGGAISEGIVQMTIADMFFVHQYATMNGLFLLMQSVGAYLGPVASGFVVQSQGWRWMWWWCAIFLGVSLVMVLFFFEESAFSPPLVGQSSHVPPTKYDEEKTEVYTAPDPDNILERAVSYTNADPIPMKKPRARRLQLITRTEESLLPHFYHPFVILFKFPAVAYAALTYGSLLAWFTIFFTVSSTYLFYPPWNFNSVGVGLINIAPFVGSVIGFLAGPLTDKMVVWLARRNNGMYEPEMRLYPALPGALFVTAGILIFGLGTAQGLPWIVLAIGFTIYSIGFMVCADIALSYLTDSYKNLIGDALVGVILVRNGASMIISFCLTQWIDGMGLQNMFILTAVTAFVVLLLPVPLLIWGKAIRLKTADYYLRFSSNQRPTTG